MRPKKQLISNLTLSQNFRLVMAKEGLTFKDVAKRAGVSEATAYRMVERTPALVTKQLVKVGKYLGFTEKQIREKAAQERLAKGSTYSKKGRLYQLITEIVELFEMERR
jgi:transposase